MPPKITNVRIRLVDNMPRLKAYCDVTVDDSLLLKDAKVIKTAVKYHVAFPKHGKQSPECVVLLDSNTRTYFERTIVNAYSKALLERGNDNAKKSV